MGRALFSTQYHTPPVVAVRTEPQPISPYEKWSIWNPFDPESDEFNRDAQREVFIDTEAYRQEQEAVQALLVADPSNDNSSASESSDSDRGSPMAVGPDDPAALIANAYSNVEWDPHWIPTTAGAATEWVVRRGTAPGTTGNQIRPRLTRPRSTTESTGPPFLPPSSLRNSMTASEIEAEASAARRTSQNGPHTANILPIGTSAGGRTAAPPFSPPSPPDITLRDEIHAILGITPSSVSSQHYTWREMSSEDRPSQTSPAGPLTNPSARMSLTRIEIAPARVRIQNAAV